MTTSFYIVLPTIIDVYLLWIGYLFLRGTSIGDVVTNYDKLLYPLGFTAHQIVVHRTTCFLLGVGGGGGGWTKQTRSISHVTGICLGYTTLPQDVIFKLPV